MTDTFLFFLFCNTAVLVGGLYWGYQFALYRHPMTSPKSIHEYLLKYFPDKWTAYKQGVIEGYTQGLRDAQEEHK